MSITRSLLDQFRQKPAVARLQCPPLSGMSRIREEAVTFQLAILARRRRTRFVLRRQGGRQPVIRVLVVCLILVAGTADAQAWGAAGHAIVAEMAQRQVRPETLIAVRQLLGTAVSMASVSNWADTMALLRPQTRPWHFVNIRVESEAYDPARDCADERCVVGAISRQRAILADRARPPAERAEALKFLIHLVADIHQPLHCATRGDDLGGSLLPVTCQGQLSNLHAFWDVTIVEAMTYDWGETASRLGVVAPGQGDSGGRPEDWAFETHRLAVEVAYDVPADGIVTDAYRARAAAVADRQMVRSAARLAGLLESTLGA